MPTFKELGYMGSEKGGKAHHHCGHHRRVSLDQGVRSPSPRGTLEVSPLEDQQWASQSHEGKEGPQAGHSILWRNFLRK